MSIQTRYAVLSVQAFLVLLLQVCHVFHRLHDKFCFSQFRLGNVVIWMLDLMLKRLRCRPSAVLFS